MTDFVLPTQSSFDALTTSGYTLNDSDAGFITKEVGGIVKLLADQMPSNELIHVRATRTSTGKTEKFIIDNIADWAAGPKIVTSDYFGDTFLDCTEFFTTTGNDDKIFKNTMASPVVAVDGDGIPTTLTYERTGAMASDPAPWKVQSATEIVIDLTVDPQARNSSQIANHTGAAGSMELMVNSSGTALGSDEPLKDNVHLAIVMPNPVATEKPAWDALGHSTLFSNVFNTLPVNGVMMVNHTWSPSINLALWGVLDAHVNVGHTYEATWITTDGDEVKDVACIKRLS